MCREGLGVCVNFEFDLLHHVGVVAKRVCAAAETAHEGDDNTPRGKKSTKSEKFTVEDQSDLYKSIVD